MADDALLLCVVPVGILPSGRAAKQLRLHGTFMKILFLHGWNSTLGGVKPAYFKSHGHEVLNPALPDDDFGAAVRIAQAEFDREKPDVVVGSSRGGAVAMNIKAGDTPLVLLCPAWKRWGTATKVKFGTVILHSPADDVVPFADSEELVRNSGLPSGSLIEVGNEHRLAGPESLAKMLEAVEGAASSIAVSETYARWLDLARKTVAILFSACGLGCVVCANLGWELAAAIFSFGTLVCLIAAFGLFVEYLIRSWFETRRNGTKPYQFTLAEMLVATTATALVLGFFRLWGAAMVAVLVVIIIIAGCGIEFARRGRTSPRNPGSPTSQPGVTNTAHSHNPDLPGPLSADCQSALLGDQRDEQD